MGKAIGVLIIIVGIAGAIYGGYWVAKTVSYKLFYEDMVRETVRDIVKQDALR